MKTRIRALVSLILISTGCVCLAAAQAPPPPPPPPLIWEAPEAKDFEDVVDEENKFRVTFPGFPTRTVYTVDDRTQTAIRLYRKGSNSSVTVLQFQENIDGNKADVYESYKTRLADFFERGSRPRSTEKVEILFDRLINVGGINGREFGFASGFHFVHLAVFARGNQLFEVKSDVTNWPILSKYNPDIAKAFRGEANRFVQSITFLK